MERNHRYIDRHIVGRERDGEEGKEGWKEGKEGEGTSDSRPKRFIIKTNLP